MTQGNLDIDERRRMPLIGRRPWAFALLYMGLSLVVEIFLIVVIRLRVPEDNAKIAPVLLTIPPVLAAWISGFRRPPRDLWTVAALASVLTLLVTAVVTRITGINTGLVEPIINRSAAGWLAAVITNRIAAPRRQGEPETRSVQDDRGADGGRVVAD